MIGNRHYLNAERRHTHLAYLAAVHSVFLTSTTPQIFLNLLTLLNA